MKTCLQTSIGGLLVLLMTSLLAQGSQKNGLSTTLIKVKSQQYTIAGLIKEIENQTEYGLTYAEDETFLQRSVNLSFNTYSLTDLLALMLEGTGMSYNHRGNSISLYNSAIVAGSATLRGKVTDEITKEALPGAAILIEGSSLGTATDLAGDFLLRSVPEDQEISLKVTYLGYQEKVVKVRLQPKEVKILNIGLLQSDRILNEVVVQAQSEGQEKALNQQRTADNIKNVVSADLIGRFPDLNVAEALQRVPGVNIQRSRGEGSQVSLRGTPLNFTTLSINGEQIPTTNIGGSRNEELDMIPVDQLSSMEVTKSTTPDMDGDAIGGNINLRTQPAVRYKPKIKAEIGGGYNDISGNFNGIGKLSYERRLLKSERFEKGRMGVKVGGSYFRTNNARDRVETDGPTGWQLRNFNGNQNVINEFGTDQVYVYTLYRYRDLLNTRTRSGLSATVDYKFNEKNDIIFNVMYSRRSDDEQEGRTRFETPDLNNWISPTRYVNNGRMRKELIDRFKLKQNLTTSVEGISQVGKYTLDYGAFFTFTEDRTDIIRAQWRTNSNLTFNVNNFGSDFVTFSTEGADIHDPFLYPNFASVAEDVELAIGKNYLARINLTRDYRWRRFNVQVKTGAKVRLLSNEVIRNNRPQTPNPGLGIGFVNFLSSFEDSKFMDGKIRFGPTPDADKLGAWFRENNGNSSVLAPTTNDQFQTDRDNSTNTFGTFEDVYAGYAMVRMKSSRSMYLFGLRLEATNVGYNANLIDATSDRVNSITPVTGTSTYIIPLPNFHYKYSINTLTNVRFSLNRSFARPNFIEIVPREIINPLNNEIEQGNPNLKPQVATNIDLLIERYLPSVGILSGGIFAKQIDDFIFRSALPQDRVIGKDVNGNDSTERFTVYQPQNGKTAYLYGAEVNLQVPLTFMPGFIKRLDLFFNYTYTNSVASTLPFQIPGGVIPARTGIRFPGQAPHTFNAALSYSHKGFSARASLNYNGEFIALLGERPEEDVYRAGRFQLDLNAAYSFKKHYRVFGEIINLTNQSQVDFLGLRSRITNVEFYGLIARFGVGLNF